VCLVAVALATPALLPSAAPAQTVDPCALSTPASLCPPDPEPPRPTPPRREQDGRFGVPPPPEEDVVPQTPDDGDPGTNFAVEAGARIIKWFLGAGQDNEVAPETVRWLVSTPSPVEDGTEFPGPIWSYGPSITKLESATAAVGLALVGVTLTFAVIHFWLAGLSGRGGGDLGEGLLRGIGAALAIVVWPHAFREVVELANLIASELMGPRVETHVSRILTDAVSVSDPLRIAPVLLLMIVVVLAFVALLGLVMMKIAAGIVLVVLFVGMPIALGLWPLPATAWLASTGGRGLVVAAGVPVVWALSFACMEAVRDDAISASGMPVFDDLLPLGFIFLNVTLGWHLARTALAELRRGGGGGGLLGRMSGLFFLASTISNMGRSGRGGKPSPESPGDVLPPDSDPTLPSTPPSGSEPGGPGEPPPGSTPILVDPGPPGDGDAPGSEPSAPVQRETPFQAAIAEARRRDGSVGLAAGMDAWNRLSPREQRRLMAKQHGRSIDEAGERTQGSTRAYLAHRSTDGSLPAGQRRAYGDLAAMTDADRWEAIPTRAQFGSSGGHHLWSDHSIAAAERVDSTRFVATAASDEEGGP
jgi:hypothetical protein